MLGPWPMFVLVLALAVQEQVTGLVLTLAVGHALGRVVPVLLQVWAVAWAAKLVAAPVAEL